MLYLSYSPPTLTGKSAKTKIGDVQMLPFQLDRRIRSWPGWLKAPLHAARLLARGMPRQAQWPFKAFFLQVGTLVGNALSTKRERECLACGWSGRKFLPDWGFDRIVPDTVCPSCGCYSRYHLYFWWLRRFLGVQPCSEMIRVLEIAPRQCSAAFFEQAVHVHSYSSCDLSSSLAMSRQDVTSLGFRDDTFGIVLCSHVMEHVRADVTGMRELYRVTSSPEGVALIQAPVAWSRQRTREYSAPRPEESGHVRSYGRDYVQKLESAGFRVEILDTAEQLDGATRLRHGIKSDRLVVAYKD